MFRDVYHRPVSWRSPHENCVKVQDPYSLRCQPQVMGACLTQIRQAAEVILIESNAVSDNPLVFTDNGDIIQVVTSMQSLLLWQPILQAYVRKSVRYLNAVCALLMDTHMSQCCSS